MLKWYGDDVTSWWASLHSSTLSRIFFRNKRHFSAKLVIVRKESDAWSYNSFFYIFLQSLDEQLEILQLSINNTYISSPDPNTRLLQIYYIVSHTVTLVLPLLIIFPRKVIISLLAFQLVGTPFLLIIRLVENHGFSHHPLPSRDHKYIIVFLVLRAQMQTIRKSGWMIRKAINAGSVPTFDILLQIPKVWGDKL